MKTLYFDKVFVLAADLEKTKSGYRFRKKDKNGFLGSHIRIMAARILRQQGRIKKTIVVGGLTKEGKSKAQWIASQIGEDVLWIESKSNTLSNLMRIKKYLRRRKGRNGILTNFYHLPRAMLLAGLVGVEGLVPICAEAILLADNPKWKNKLIGWYKDKSMLTRIASEIRGSKDLLNNTYRK